MESLLTPGILGIILIILGVMNMNGNISSLHWYHRRRVAEEDKKPFGKLVGLGTLIIGITMILFGVLFFIFEKTQIMPLVIVGAVFLVAGIVAGLGLAFYAMIKYNKGIF